MTVLKLVRARELDRRSSRGITVTLFWSPVENSTWVSVEDATTGDTFTVDVHAGERASDVFHHPYAYHVARRTARHPQPTTSARGFEPFWRGAARDRCDGEGAAAL